MGKFKQAQDKVYAIFGSSAWQAEQVKTYPVGFEGEKGDPPYIRVSVVHSGGVIGYSQSSGLIMVEIFAPWSQGPAKVTEIADKLDNYLEKKTLGAFQMAQSTLGNFVRDRDNSTLGKSIYQVPFVHYGVTE